MTNYTQLGSRTVTGSADTTGNNTGNWTVAFTPDILASSLTDFEIYKIVVHAAVGSSFQIMIETRLWDVCNYGQLNVWEPNGDNGMPVRAAETVFFYFLDPTTDNVPPVVTIWMRVAKPPGAA